MTEGLAYAGVAPVVRTSKPKQEWKPEDRLEELCRWALTKRMWVNYKDGNWLVSLKYDYDPLLAKSPTLREALEKAKAAVEGGER
jgi:hypothetical protein